MLLHACPDYALAHTHPDVVASLHGLCILLKLAHQVLLGLVNALLHSNGVGTSSHSLGGGGGQGGDNTQHSTAQHSTGYASR